MKLEKQKLEFEGRWTRFFLEPTQDFLTNNQRLKSLPRNWKKQLFVFSSFSSSIYLHPRKRIRHVCYVCGFSTWDRPRRRHLHSKNSNCVSSSFSSIYVHVSHPRTMSWIQNQLYAASWPEEIRRQIHPAIRNPMIWVELVLFLAAKKQWNSLWKLKKSGTNEHISMLTKGNEEHRMKISFRGNVSVFIGNYLLPSEVKCILNQNKLSRKCFFLY